jgi:peptide/nickel transport system substrate-binding protein
MRKSLFILGIAALSVLLVSTITLAAGDVLVIGNETDARTEDPQKVHDHQEGQIAWNVYEGLLKYDVADFSIKPVLAVSWEVAQDLKSCTFHLRQGIKFHDGTPFNADAVAYAMERLLALGQTPATYLQTVKSWKVIDSYTITFYTDAAWALWEDAFASHKGLSIPSPTFVKAHATKDDPWAENWMGDHTCGTGPYTLAEWVKGQYVKAVWYPEYWGGWPTDKTFFKTIILKYIPEISMRTLLLKSGEIDYTAHINPRDIDELRADPKIQVEVVSAMAQMFIFLNQSKPPLYDAKLREAISYAIDYQACADTYLPGTKVAHGILSSSMPGFEPSIPESKQDMAKAKQLFAAAGYKPGEVEIELVPIAGTFEVDTALVVQQNLAELGIKVNIKPLPWSIYQDLRLNAETMPQMSFMYLELFLADPIGIFDEGFTPDAIFKTGYNNPQVGLLIDGAQGLASREERWGVYKLAQQLVYPDHPALYMWEMAFIFAHRADVKGFVPDRMHLSLDVHSLWRG